MRFVKMHGLGNDYVYADAFTDPALERRPDLRDLARAMSDRNTGVGSDGLILVCRPRAGGDARMRMFNSDGSESEMCGNGVRCVAKFAHDRLGIRARPIRIETGAGMLSIDYHLSGGALSDATVDMGEPILDAPSIPVRLPVPAQSDRIVGFPLDLHIPIDLDSPWIAACGLDPAMTCVSMGNPHAVLFCTAVDAVPLETIGPFLEGQPIFPRRTNVHFVQVLGREEARMRTWERGAGPTRACGTGACAVGVAGALTGRMARNVWLHLPGGDLQIHWDERTNHVFKTGPATFVFEGEWPDDHEKVSR